jgi:hypothetical protein
MILLIPRCSVPGALAGDRAWPDEALTDILCHLCSLCILHHIQWLVLAEDPSAPGKGLEWMGK